MNLLGSLAIAFSMYSRIPMPQVKWTKERMGYAMCFFPLIGAVIGMAVYLSGIILQKAGFPLFAILFSSVLPLLITGGIHMDGFLDVTDARASHAEKERKLEILKDPHTGAFAITGCAVYLILYIGALGELRLPYLAAFCGSFVLTRALSGLAVVTFPMAKKSGLAAVFSSQAEKKTVKITMICYMAVTAIFVCCVSGAAAVMTLAVVSLLVYIYYYFMSKREFGGITGDLAGYFLQICELASLICLAALSHLQV